jgi:hypothetical protein
MSKIKTSLTLEPENLEWLNTEAVIQTMLRGRKVTPSALMDEYVTEKREMDTRKKKILGKLMKEIREVEA